MRVRGEKGWHINEGRNRWTTRETTQAHVMAHRSFARLQHPIGFECGGLFLRVLPVLALGLWIWVKQALAQRQITERPTNYWISILVEFRPSNRVPCSVH